MNGFVEKWPVTEVMGPVNEAGMVTIKEMKEGHEGDRGQGMRMLNEVCNTSIDVCLLLLYGHKASASQWVPVDNIFQNIF